VHKILPAECRAARLAAGRGTSRGRRSAPLFTLEVFWAGAVVSSNESFSDRY
jgi:hypothetical protein